ncbi:PPC domain-containing DNA-binding protein [Moorena producens]|uniref:PPC domain-containing DNA-binding protein n=1 Tax=Moorena producens TaxID=1155739 RepID=UPI000B00DBC9|nr:PPC domain-containing DNA-binding protein [Moorena producens]
MIEAFAIRIQPDQDLKVSLINVVKKNTIQAGFILTAVGSLKQANLRFANQNTSKLLIEKFEIVSLVGTLSIHGVHLHISLADKNGKVIGGHLAEDCIIYTTAEIVIGTSEEFSFIRTLDQTTGYKELEVRHKNRVMSTE